MNKKIIDDILDQDAFVVGELTTDAGPYADDHFIVLLAKHSDLLEFPINSDEARYLVERIERDLKKRIVPRLSNSTSFKSIVLYPKALEDIPFFDVCEDSGKNRISNFIKNLGLSKDKFRLSKPVKLHLGIECLTNE